MEANNYKDFLESKIRVAIPTGFDIHIEEIHPILKPHQRDVVAWNIKGGNRADFLNFGLGKTLIQLETLRQIVNNKGGKALFVCPLAVNAEFVNDSRLIGIKEIRYITNSDHITDDCDYYITNYERVQMGNIDPAAFIAVSMDEASVLRSLDTQTTQEILSRFSTVEYKFVATATPAPNRYLELINYAEYLGIMDRGQALTRFFQRNSEKAGDLTLLPSMESEFWYWMSSWACFITKPSDLGYDDEGYALPPLNIHKHLVTVERDLTVTNGQGTLIPVASESLPDAAREKKRSISDRLDVMQQIINENPDDHYILWHHLEDERHEIQKRLGKTDCRSVYGSQSIEEKEFDLIGFARGDYKYLSTKPKIAGSGCNFQYHCHKAIFVGIDYKFNDFIQAVHRIFRFMQEHACDIHLIYTETEMTILNALLEKWEDHINLQSEMTAIIKKHGLNSELYQSDLKRKMFANRLESKGNSYHLVNNDAIDEWSRVESDSIGLIVSSIPFGNHYEYSDNYNCLGHNPTNEDFFRQMDFLVPELYRSLMPGRIAAIHVKDRIRYSYMNGTGFTSIDPFSDDTTRCFRKHGFHLLSRITIDTDVVQENNQTYRLSYSEACKDMTKMGAGLPEYLLVFRKAPTENQNAYADIPVIHEKNNYSLAQWQLDAHAHWKTSGERLISSEYLKKTSLSDILKLWKVIDKTERYDYRLHIQLCQQLDALKKLPRTYMAVPPQSNSEDIWSDISRVNTLNSSQSRKKLTKHICPLQIDIVERAIERWSNPGEIVADPFTGIGTVPCVSVKMNRFGFGTELKTEYFLDSIKHTKGAEIDKNSVLSLFDIF